MAKKSNPIGRTQWDLINQIWESAPWKILNRIATLLIIICILIFFYIQVLPVPEIISRCLYRCMSKVSDTNVYTLTVPANTLWVNSGIQVHEKDTIEIQVSGSVNVAMHRCVENAISDVLPQNPWINYPALHGDSPPPLPPDDARKSLCAIRRDVPLGILLMYIWDGKGPQPSPVSPFVDSNFVKDIMQPTEATISIHISCNRSGTLFFVINDGIATEQGYLKKESMQCKDILFNLQKIKASFDGKQPFRPTSEKEARYCGLFLWQFGGSIPKTEKEIENFYREKWNLLPIEYRNRLWFEDNIGSYQVQIRKK